MEHRCAYLGNNRMIEKMVYYQINEVHQWEERPAPEGTSGDIQYLSGSEILAQMEP